ncbi:hypothetical protein KKC1_09880 [Calderihabitans maritimus]|uniref:Uncharacterized protein n=1 Tax=Calderihabitans maritimus TaxID=1246530 RepID=A0A1Z5HQW5_9FIRM|nr:hypothetical protein KKC1_09880 [Calderihabitans maritimus]
MGLWSSSLLSAPSTLPGKLSSNQKVLAGNIISIFFLI